MADRWIVTPQFFESPEPTLAAVAPASAQINRVEMAHRSPPELAILHGGIAAFVEEAVRDGNRPVSLAGDCCAAVPVTAGLQRAGLTPSLVWIDAHGDFNTPETSPSQFLGGMPLAMLVGRGPQWMLEGVGCRPIDEAEVMLVDARDLDPLEAAAVAESRLTHVGLGEIADFAFDGAVHLHLDLDVIDAADCPAFRYPVAGGPALDDVVMALGAFAARAPIVAVSISGWTGALDRDGRTAEGAKRCLDAILA
ncbi:MAG: arginase family protein [Paracoccaceae bacterium]